MDMKCKDIDVHGYVMDVERISYENCVIRGDHGSTRNADVHSKKNVKFKKLIYYSQDVTCHTDKTFKVGGRKGEIFFKWRIMSMELTIL